MGAQVPGLTGCWLTSASSPGLANATLRLGTWAPGRMPCAPTTTVVASLVLSIVQMMFWSRTASHLDISEVARRSQGMVDCRTPFASSPIGRGAACCARWCWSSGPRQPPRGSTPTVVGAHWDAPACPMTAWQVAQRSRSTGWARFPEQLGIGPGLPVRGLRGEGDRFSITERNARRSLLPLYTVMNTLSVSRHSRWSPTLARDEPPPHRSHALPASQR